MNPWRLVLKSLLLFVVFNLIFALWNPSGLGKVSFYNRLFPGRLRLPYGENPAQSYNLSLYDLEAMFASHVIAEPKAADEFRVVLIGDSALWGWLLHPEDTLAGQLDAANLMTCDGRKVRVYNLGYPTISLTKDLLILDQAMRYKPDLVVWLFTLEAFPDDKQLTPPLVANNPERARMLIETYDLPFDPNDPALARTKSWDQTILVQRRPLADLLRLQLYGAMWAATGLDQLYPQEYERAQTDFEPDESFHDMQPPILDEENLAFEVLGAGVNAAGGTPIVLVNEPMLISRGKNSDLRYNYYSPRWAYDQYRQVLAEKASAGNWNYFDLWDLVPADEFTNTPFHMTPAGESLLAAQMEAVIQQQVCP